MSRSQDVELEARSERKFARTGRLVDGGLYNAVSRAGGILLGLSVKMGEYDCLMTLRAEFPAGRMVAFVGGDSWTGVMLKAAREAETDGLRWKEDKFAR